MVSYDKDLTTIPLSSATTLFLHWSGLSGRWHSRRFSENWNDMNIHMVILIMFTLIDR